MQSPKGVLWKRCSATLLKKRLWHRCFPVNFAKFTRTPFFTEHLWWLLLSLLWATLTTTLGNPFKVLRNCLKEQMWLVLHVVYLKIFLWNPSGQSIFRDCSLNQFRTEKLAEYQIIECIDSLECTCCLQFWQFQRNIKKTSIVFDEGLQILVFRKVYLGFFMLFNAWQN